MAYMLDSLSERWRRVNGQELVTEVLDGVVLRGRDQAGRGQREGGREGRRLILVSDAIHNS